MWECNLKLDGGLIMSFDIYLWFGDVVKCREDIFYVEVKYKEMVD